MPVTLKTKGLQIIHAIILAVSINVVNGKIPLSSTFNTLMLISAKNFRPIPAKQVFLIQLSFSINGGWM